jgi:ketosteroid isomerase-like protein
MERTSTGTTLTEELGELNRKWMEAYVKRDTTFLERCLSEDYVSTFPDGTSLDKNGEIESVRSGAVVLTEMKPTEMDTRVYGEVAVIIGRSTIKAKVKGRDESGDYRFIDVWVKRGDRWQAVASQVTRISNSGAADER